MESALMPSSPFSHLDLITSIHQYCFVRVVLKRMHQGSGSAAFLLLLAGLHTGLTEEIDLAGRSSA